MDLAAALVAGLAALFAALFVEALVTGLAAAFVVDLAGRLPLAPVFGGMIKHPPRSSPAHLPGGAGRTPKASTSVRDETSRAPGRASTAGGAC